MMKERPPARAAHTLGQLSSGTIIVEADADAPDLARRLTSLLTLPGVEHELLLIACLEENLAIAASVLASDFPPLRIVALSSEQPGTHGARLFDQVRTERVAFLSAHASVTPPQWSELTDSSSSLMFWVPDIPIPQHSARDYPINGRCWLASTDLLRNLEGLGSVNNWSLLHVARVAESRQRTVRWHSPHNFSSTRPRETPDNDSHEMGRGSSVLAVVPHYHCEEWLGQCLSSLLAQTEPLAGIVVVDDHSAEPPVEVLREFPQVTLLLAAENVGPYRLVQEVINRTDYDAYLFQDADDWSACDRLEILLDEAARTGAELVGSQELRVLAETEEIVPVCYPLDVSRALAEHEGHPLLHPTSLISRGLVQRSGGFSTALRFGGDTEMLLRVGLAARVANVARYCYFHRHRAASLTTSAETGLESPARVALRASIKEWAERHRPLRARGDWATLSPYAVADPVSLTHLLGPRLKLSAGHSIQ
jgi:hypothetical protein